MLQCGKPQIIRIDTGPAFTSEEDLYLPLPQYTYNTMPRPMFPGMSSYEVFYGVVRPEFVRFTRKPQLPEHCVQTCEDFIRMRKKCC